MRNPSARIGTAVPLVRKQLHTLVTASFILQLRTELAADELMDELQRPASTSASFLNLPYKRRAICGELCIQTDVPPYHWPGAVTWRLISGVFAKATWEFSAAQHLVASRL
ncbi:hypothetical protein F5888DRAFT_1803528 [Russula emetica]|nr:hypothetical protein F5888DRAFT_1803528 [Russula emetica]